ncbi:MAG: hypothetical protein ABSC06_17365 [Rhodopila sp.]|jgi:hypothetical protein
MSIPATIAKAILDTVLARLVLLFLSAAAGNTEAAREAATQMLAAHDPRTADELTLAAQIVTLQFHALEALANAAEPGLSLNRILRLRGSAVSLSRESHKARRRLDQIQRARQTPEQPAQAVTATAQAAAPTPPAPTPPAEPPLPEPGAQAALDLVATAQEALRIAKKTGGRNWAHTLQKRLLTAQMTQAAKTQQARYAAQLSSQSAAVPQTAA